MEIAVPTKQLVQQAMFLLSNAVQSEIYIYDNDKDDQRAGGGI